MSVVRELEPAGVPEHVRVDREGELRRLGDRRQQLAEGRGRHGPASLGGEHVNARWHLLALQASEVADFVAPDEVHAGAAVLAAGDVVATLREVEHVPAQGAKLACPEPVAVLPRSPLGISEAPRRHFPFSVVGLLPFVTRNPLVCIGPRYQTFPFIGKNGKVWT